MGFRQLFLLHMERNSHLQQNSFLVCIGVRTKTIGSLLYNRVEFAYNNVTRYIPICQVMSSSLHLTDTTGLYFSKEHMTIQEFLRLARLYPVAAAIKSNEDMRMAL